MSTAAPTLSQRDVNAVLHPYTQLQQHQQSGPLVMARGDGVYVEDSQGRRGALRFQPCHQPRPHWLTKLLQA